MARVPGCIWRRRAACQLLAAACLLQLLAASPAAAARQLSADDDTAPPAAAPQLRGPNAKKLISLPDRALAIPDEYIIIFAPSIGDVNRLDRNSVGNGALKLGNVRETYSIRSFQGMLVQVVPNNAQRMLQSLVDDARVLHVEPNMVVTALQTQTQTNAVWGTSRTDDFGAFNGNSNYQWTSNGTNVAVYIVDTGINSGHVDFQGRTVEGTCTLGATGGCSLVGPAWADDQGHGTHVAGTACGSTFGIAKACKLVPVKVLSSTGSGSIASVANGISWVVSHSQPAGTSHKVINLSLGGGASLTLDSAVNNAISAGITVVAAAGNSNADACSFSPARAPAAITVGSIDISSARSSFSNFGTCLDMFAPGRGILSAYIGSPTAAATLSGTSMAAPQVAGLAARILHAGLCSSSVGASRAACVRNFMVNTATVGVVTSPGTGSPNVIAYGAPAL